MADGTPTRDLCECCGRDTPTSICLDGAGNAVLLCIDCSDMLTPPGPWSPWVGTEPHDG